MRISCAIFAMLLLGCSSSDDSEDDYRVLYYVNATNKDLLLNITFISENGDTTILTDVAQSPQSPSWDNEIDAVLGDTLFISASFSHSNPDSLWSVWPLSLAVGIEINHVDGGARILTRSSNWPDSLVVTKQFIVE